MFLGGPFQPYLVLITKTQPIWQQSLFMDIAFPELFLTKWCGPENTFRRRKSLLGDEEEHNLIIKCIYFTTENKTTLVGPTNQKFQTSM